jgi:sortase A
MIWQRKLGGILILAGSLLLGVYAVPTVYGAAMSHLAIAQFRAANSAQRQWDSSRILAYRHSLAVKFPPPEAILRIPRVGLEVPVLEGTDDLTMNRGAGHVTGTSLPGQPGNIAIAGHRDGFFRVLKDVVPGDTILLEQNHRTDRFIVRNLQVVQPADTSALRATAGNTLTLVTCYPFHFVGSAPRRYIVQASLAVSSPSNTPSGD